MNAETELKISRFISLILRHKPEIIGAKLDIEGWCDVDALLKGCNISFAELEKIVKDDDKGRYSFNENKTKIRANQGHSVIVDLKLKQLDPPKILYHGTSQKHLNSILETGINKATRHHVHLTDDYETAINVGARRKGTTIVCVIDSDKMKQDGCNFYLSDNNVWLCDYVPNKYILKYIKI